MGTTGSFDPKIPGALYAEQLGDLPLIDQLSSALCPCAVSRRLTVRPTRSTSPSQQTTVGVQQTLGE
jgi:hypothetical protein